MTIERNGEIIELTKRELFTAYYEAQHEKDKEEIGYYINCMDSDDPRRKELKDSDFVDKVAFRYRKYLDDDINEDAEYQCFYDAYDYVKNGWTFKE